MHGPHPQQAEEAVLYPALRQHLGPEGATLANHAQREHAGVDCTTTELLRLLPTDYHAAIKKAEQLQEVGGGGGHQAMRGACRNQVNY